jgi:NarL family two-component system sensor histidine kinase YdfH
MRQEIEHFQAATGIACEYDPAALPCLPEAASEQVLRVVRECLTNVARHAQARHVWIRVRARQPALHMEIADDGVGFDVAAAGARSGHYGLPGLRERARLLGGDVEIQSTPGVGTVICFSLPR